MRLSVVDHDEHPAESQWQANFPGSMHIRTGTLKRFQSECRPPAFFTGAKGPFIHGFGVQL